MQICCKTRRNYRQNDKPQIRGGYGSHFCIRSPHITSKDSNRRGCECPSDSFQLFIFPQHYHVCSSRAQHCLIQAASQTVRQHIHTYVRTSIYVYYICMYKNSLVVIIAYTVLNTELEMYRYRRNINRVPFPISVPNCTLVNMLVL